MESFSRLGLADPLAAALGSFGFAAPTPVQTEAIPTILSRRDAIIESETGTGKTFAYLAPGFQLVSVLERRGAGEPGVIVAAPTQELAVQIGRESERLAKAAGLGLKTVVLLGGTPLEKQAAKLKSKPEIVVGTLGRLADLVSLGKLRASSLKLLVLDEADRLFANETEELARALLRSAPPSCTRVLVSATMPERVRREVRPLLRDAAEICPVGETVLSGSIEHWCFYCDGRKRLDFARRFESAVRPERCLVFLTMATRVEKAALALAALGLPVGAIHSGMDKETRRVALERFAGGELRYLLTSDLGARGLDIPGITHVLSLDLPDEPTVYTHRAGRTGRAGAVGVSIVLADGVELARASKIATKGGFVFRCKVLEEGKILEPTSEEFFARAGAAEEQRLAARASHVSDDESRSPGPKRRDFKSPPQGHQGRDTKSPPQGFQRRDTKSSPPGSQRRDTKSSPTGSQRRDTKSSPTGFQRRDTKSAPPVSQGRYTQSAPQGSQGRHTKSSPTGFQRRDTQSSPQGFQRRDTKSSPQGHQGRDTKSSPTGFQRRDTKSSPQGHQGRDTKSSPTGFQRRDTKSAPPGPQGRYTQSSPQGFQRRDTKSSPTGFQRRDTKSSPTGFQRRDTKSSPTGFQRRDTKSPPQGHQGRDTKSAPQGPQGHYTKSAPPDSMRHTKSAPAGYERRVAKSPPQGSRGRRSSVPEAEAPRTATKPRSAPWRPSSETSSPAPHSMLHKKSAGARGVRPPDGDSAKPRRPPRP